LLFKVGIAWQSWVLRYSKHAIVMAGEDKEEQEARVEELWRTLDTRKEGRLDANGLRRGLEKIDHRKCTIIMA
jgi:hypothetical protein